MAYNSQYHLRNQFQHQNQHQSGWMKRLQASPETMQRTINNLNQQLNEFQRQAIRESAQLNEQLYILQQRINELETTNRELQEQLQEQQETNKEFTKEKIQPKSRIFTVQPTAKHRNPKLLMRSNPKKAIQRAIEGNHILKMVVVFPYDDPTANYKKAIQITAEKSNYFKHLSHHAQANDSEMTWEPEEHLCANETKDEELQRLSPETLRNFYYSTSYNTSMIVPEEGSIMAIFTKPKNPYPDNKTPNTSGYGFPFIIKEEHLELNLLENPYDITLEHLEMDEYNQPKKNPEVRWWF